MIFIGLISESIILGIGILILLILCFSMTVYLKKKIRRKSFWDYIIVSVYISLAIFGTIGLIGVLFFIGLIWESIILGIGILILLILCFSMTVYLKKKIRRKSFWDYIIVSVYISLAIFGTIGLIGVLFFIGLISESIILGIGILILLILFFLMTGYLREKIRRKSFWDYFCSAQQLHLPIFRVRDGVVPAPGEVAVLVQAVAVPGAVEEAALEV
ncbi:hypothetical protein LEP1GSC170_1978 [Leptospira interrogans serovar Bataviae str. HAI135]|nr:hypothetical protein LEP1GSC170_1978 [Leptospira interrogans serovar Bataviae str. HAI135]